MCFSVAVSASSNIKEVEWRRIDSNALQTPYPRFAIMIWHRCFLLDFLLVLAAIASHAKDAELLDLTVIGSGSWHVGRIQK